MQADPSPQPPGADTAAYPPIGKAQLWLIALLVLATILAFTDRSILSVLVDPIKADLKIDDVQASLLMGLSFSVIYSAAALPFGALTDVLNRRNLLAVTILAWSAMTVFSGFAGSFGLFFIGRMGLGISEAALGPASFSLIRDTFAPAYRGRAFATMQASHQIGTGAALAGGGLLFGLAGSGAFSRLPIVGALHPWQQVLIIVGLIGVPLAGLMMTMKEPPRVRTEAAAAAARNAPGFAEALSFVGRNRRVFIPYWIAVSLLQIAVGGMSWVVMTVHRTWHVPIPAIGAVIGPTQIALGLIGAFSFGTFLDLITRRGLRDAPLKVGSAWLSVVAAAAIALFFVTSLPVAMALYVVMLFFLSANSTSAAAALALIAPAHLAGKLQSITGLAINLTGLALGPTLVALVSEHLFTGPRALHDAMLAVISTCLVLGLTMYGLVLRALSRRHGANGAEASA
jgi:MFS family permease